MVGFTASTWRPPSSEWRRATPILALAAISSLAGCARSAGDGSLGASAPPHVPEGTPDEPTIVEVLFPDPDLGGIETLVNARPSWSGLMTESQCLRSPAAFPQPKLDPPWIEAGERALADLFAPLAGVRVRLGPTPEAVANPAVVALVLVEMLPDSAIRRLHGSDAFTESFYEYETRRIRRAIVHLPLFLLDHDPDDFANFLEHELGHALGQEAHLEEMSAAPSGEAWFWDRLMTIPICLGQPWQPATTEDVLVIATGRYTLRPGWDTERVMRFSSARPYHPTRADLALAEERWERLRAAGRVDR